MTSKPRAPHLERRADGQLYVLEPWPARTFVAVGWARIGTMMKVKGKEVTIRCANGEAQYVMRRPLGWADVWECELAHSTFRPMMP